MKANSRMKSFWLGALAIAVSAVGFGDKSVHAQGDGAEAQTTPSAGMLRYPDVSQSHIVFSYAGDLWIVDREGGTAVPLASPEGSELFPRFNAAGDKIAFVGNYEGDRDLYTIDVQGGNAERLTYHPADEVLCDWAADGKLVFSSNGHSGLGRVSQLFTISESMPYATPLAVPYGTNGAVSADGKWLAYTPHSRDTRTWKRYRGGMASDIWLFNLETHESKQVTDWEGTDSLPMWHGDKLYYLSDNGEQQRLNIWVYDVANDSHEQVTDFADFDCKWPSIGPGTAGQGEIVLQNGSNIWLVDLATGDQTTVEITIPGDRPAVRARSVDVSEFVQSGDVSPSGKRAVVEARGDIWTLPIKNGSPRNLTRTDGVAERMPSWSPDGRWIAYFSDATDEYELYVTQSDGRGETRQLTSDGNAWRYNPVWSPDSKHIVFTDKAGNIFLHTIDGETKLVDTDPFANAPDVDWSQDSGWLTYARASDEDMPTSSVYVYNVESGEKTRLTRFFNCSNPVFDMQGDYIYCSSNRAFNSPKYEDVETTFIYSDTEVLLAIPLRSDVKHPLLPKSDEVEWNDDEKKEDGDDDKEDASEDDSDGDADDANGDANGDAGSEDDGVSGEWTGRVLTEDVPDEVRSFTLYLEVAEDGSVSGRLETQQGTINIDSGSYDKSSGALKFSGSNGDAEVAVEATIKAGKLTGTAVVNGGAMSLEIEADRSSGGSDMSDEAADEDSDDKDKEDAKDKKKDEKKPVEIEFDGIERRSFQLPVSAGAFGSLAVNDKNQLIYARRASRGGGGKSSINLFDIKDEKKAEKTVVDGASNFGISANHKKLVILRGDDFFLVDAAAGQKMDKKFQTRGLTATINPKSEWKQVFNDAWRVERDFFYDPTMHGVDWEAVREHYAPMIDDCTSRADVGFVIGEMISEINVGHAYYRSPPSGRGSNSVNVGLLGCSFEVADGRYRIGEIYEGADWDTDARNPLRDVGIEEGDFILEVNGLDFNTDQNPYALRLSAWPT